MDFKHNQGSAHEDYHKKAPKWSILNLWSQRMTQRWNSCFENGSAVSSISKDQMEYFFSFILDAVEDALEGRLVEKLHKQCRMFLVQPSSEDRFLLEEGRCTFRFPANELFSTSVSDSDDKVGASYDIGTYDDIAVLLDKSFRSTEIWCIHGGVVWTDPDAKHTAIKSLEMNKPTFWGPVQLLRIHIEENETQEVELLLESMEPIWEDSFKFTYFAKRANQARAITRKREPRSVYSYKTSLDRWGFPVIGPMEARNVYDFMLSNYWNDDPCWTGGGESLKFERARKFSRAPRPKCVSPIFTTDYVEQEVLNHKTLERARPTRLSIQAWIVWIFLVIVAFALIFEFKDLILPSIAALGSQLTHFVPDVKVNIDFVKATWNKVLEEICYCEQE